MALSQGPHENLARPAIDPLFRCAAVAYAPAVVGIVLTGQLDDGTSGLYQRSRRNYYRAGSAEATAPSMPQNAIRHVAIDYCCKLADMAWLLVKLANDDPEQNALGPRQVDRNRKSNRGGYFQR